MSENRPEIEPPRDAADSEADRASRDPRLARDADAAAAVRSLCRDGHRRTVLALLSYERRPLTLGDLTEAVVRHDYPASVGSVPERVVAEVHRSLERTHVPKLAEAGLVEYDPERRLVEPTAALDRARRQIRDLVEADPALDPPIEL